MASFWSLRLLGISHVAEETGISRITLYRMLSKDGNPELNSLVKVMRFLKMHLWVVDQHFIKTNRKPLVNDRSVIGTC
jgi:DNA-binding phage protein